MAASAVEVASPIATIIQFSPIVVVLLGVAYELVDLAGVKKALSKPTWSQLAEENRDLGEELKGGCAKLATAPLELRSSGSMTTRTTRPCAIARWPTCSPRPHVSGRLYSRPIFDPEDLVALDDTVLAA